MRIYGTYIFLLILSKFNSESFLKIAMFRKLELEDILGLLGDRDSGFGMPEDGWDVGCGMDDGRARPTPAHDGLTRKSTGIDKRLWKSLLIELYR